MPRIRKPSILMADGFKHDPDKLAERQNEPESNGPIGDAPKYLTKKQKDCWNELVGNAFPGVLTKADRHVMEMLAILTAQFRDKPERFNKHQQMLSLLGRLGMTPADRSTVRQPAGARQKHNKFAGLRKRPGSGLMQ